MDTQKVINRKTQLDETFAKLKSEIENIDQSIQRLQQERQQALANANAVSGALQVVNELLAPEPASVEKVTNAKPQTAKKVKTVDAEVIPINQK